MIRPHTAILAAALRLQPATLGRLRADPEKFLGDPVTGDWVRDRIARLLAKSDMRIEDVLPAATQPQ